MAKVEINIEGRDNASASLGRVRDALGDIATVAAGIVSGQLLIGAAQQIGQLGREAFEAVADFQMMEVSMRSLTARELVNSGAAADMSEAMAMAGARASELLGWIQQLAIRSPFDQAGVADAFRTAMAYGFTTEQAQRLTAATIDFATATGQGTGAMNSIALALGQIAARGRVSMQEIMQLTNAGVPAMQILAKQFQMTGAELEEAFQRGEISAEQAIDAIVTSLEEDFGGAAENSAETLAGFVNTMGDLRKLGLRALFQGVFEAAQPALAAMANSMQERLLPLMAMLGMRLGEMVEPLAKFVAKLFEGGVTLRDFLPAEVLERFRMIREGFDRLREGAAAVLPSIIDLFGRLRDRVREAFESLGPQILGNLNTILGSVGGLIEQYGPGIVEALGRVLAVGVDVVAAGVTIATGIIAGVAQGLESGDWSAAWDTVRTSVETAFTSLGVDVAAVREGFRSWMSGIALDVIEFGWQLKGGLEAAFDIVQQTPQVVADAVATALGVLTGAAGEFAAAGSAMITGAAEGVRAAIGELVAAVVAAASAAIGAFGDIIGWGSPAREFIAIGEDMMAGLAVGIDQLAKRPISLVADIAGQTVAAARPVAAPPPVIAAAGGTSGGVMIQGITIQGMPSQAQIADLFNLLDREARERGYGGLTR